MEKGIVIIAVSFSNYARMAANLAISIKLNNPEAHITLMHDTKAIEGFRTEERKFFDNFILIPNEYIYYKERVAYGRLKCFIYDLSPYQKTIYIDADTLMLPNKNINWYWAALDTYKQLWIAYDNTIVTQKNYDTISSWANVDYINTIFPELNGKKILTNLQTSLFAFEKNKEIKNIFDTALNVFEILEKTNFQSTWYNCIPDELIFAIAMCKCDIIPEQGHHYVSLIFQNPTSQELNKDYNFLSFASAQSTVPFTYMNIYNEIVKKNAERMNLSFPYTWKDKGIFIRKNSIIKRR